MHDIYNYYRWNTAWNFRIMHIYVYTCERKFLFSVMIRFNYTRFCVYNTWLYHLYTDSCVIPNCVTCSGVGRYFDKGRLSLVCGGGAETCVKWSNVSIAAPKIKESSPPWFLRYCVTMHIHIGCTAGYRSLIMNMKGTMESNLVYCVPRMPYQMYWPAEVYLLLTECWILVFSCIIIIAYLLSRV